MASLTLGITYDNSESVRQLLGGNGLSQNILFLYALLEKLGHQVCMICDKKDADFVEVENKYYSVKTATEIIEQKLHFDIIFEIGLTLVQADRFLMRERCGARIVCVRYGNSLFLDMEELFSKQTLSASSHVSRPEMVWISPHFEKSIYYFEALYHSQVEFAPFIWEPTFTLKRFSKLDHNRGYHPNIIVMEPNLGVLKNALIPLTIVSEVCKHNASVFGTALVFNSHHFCNTPYFLQNFVQNLPFLNSESNKVLFSSRYRIHEVFDHPHVMIGCQHYNGLNYLYMEALYMGVPLVHNSEHLIDVGYYYPEFDVRTGKLQTLKALTEHDFDKSLVANDEFLYRFSIDNPITQNRYRLLLEQAMATPIVTSL